MRLWNQVFLVVETFLSVVKTKHESCKKSKEKIRLNKLVQYYLDPKCLKWHSDYPCGFGQDQESMFNIKIANVWRSKNHLVNAGSETYLGRIFQSLMCFYFHLPIWLFLWAFTLCIIQHIVSCFPTCSIYCIKCSI